MIKRRQFIPTEESQLSLLWLEITGKCQLECAHCYADSGPTKSHGLMSCRDWERVIDDAAKIGVKSIQFIGGEPTLHPDFTSLLKRAVKRGLNVEVFSNLVNIKPALWELFKWGRVSLATSWYSDQAEDHERVTNRRSFVSTKNNIRKAISLGIPIRVGVIGVHENQRVKEARQMLIDLGVNEKNIGYDDLRQVGRGVRNSDPSFDQLCGNCANGVLAVSPNGVVWPCVFSRWIPLGNVLNQTLSEIIASKVVRDKCKELKQFFQSKGLWPCEPKCSPRCSPSCSPCAPGNRCWPYYDD